MTYHAVMKRDLVSVRHPRTALGAVVSDARGRRFEGQAANVLRGPINEFGEAAVIADVMEHGWANAAGLYFAEPVPS